MLEEHIIAYCSPTLASLKSGSLFSCKCSCHEDIDGCISAWNESFKPRGISLHLLRRTESAALIYMCRDSAMKNILSDPCVQLFLNDFGYENCYGCDGCSSCCCSLDECLRHLQTRLTDERKSENMSFPHEIGIFLGYPLADVSGFIENEGRNCKLIGPWKVYGDVTSAERAFAKFEKCTSIYTKLWSSGERSIMDLTVAC